MTGTIVCKDSIRVHAVAAANSGQNVNAANPHPAGTKVALLWELYFWTAVHEREAVA